MNLLITGPNHLDSFNNIYNIMDPTLNKIVESVLNLLEQKSYSNIDEILDDNNDKLEILARLISKSYVENKISDNEYFIILYLIKNLIGNDEKRILSIKSTISYDKCSNDVMDVCSDYLFYSNKFESILKLFKKINNIRPNKLNFEIILSNMTNLVNYLNFNELNCMSSGKLHHITNNEIKIRLRRIVKIFGFRLLSFFNINIIDASDYNTFDDNLKVTYFHDVINKLAIGLSKLNQFYSKYKCADDRNKKLKLKFIDLTASNDIKK